MATRTATPSAAAMPACIRFRSRSTPPAANGSLTSTSSAVAVAETYLSTTLAGASQQAGVPTTVTVQARDSGGNLLAAYANSIIISSSDALFAINGN
jgi:hypothetical protein